MLIFETFFFYRVDSRCIKRKKEDEEVERGYRGREGGRKAAEGGAGRGIFRGWKSIPLDGVTSRAQLAPARVSFRRGFRIYCLSLTGVFCQRFRFFHRQLYTYIYIYSVHDEAAAFLPVSRCPRRLSFKLRFPARENLLPLLFSALHLRVIQFLNRYFAIQ